MEQKNNIRKIYNKRHNKRYNKRCIFKLTHILVCDKIRNGFVITIQYNMH